MDHEPHRCGLPVLAWIVVGGLAAVAALELVCGIWLAG